MWTKVPGSVEEWARAYPPAGHPGVGSLNSLSRATATTAAQTNTFGGAELGSRRISTRTRSRKWQKETDRQKGAGSRNSVVTAGLWRLKISGGFRDSTPISASCYSIAVEPFPTPSGKDPERNLI